MSLFLDTFLAVRPLRELVSGGCFEQSHQQAAVFLTVLPWRHFPCWVDVASAFHESLRVVGMLLTDQRPGKKRGQWRLPVTSCRRDGVLSLWMNGRLGLLRWRRLGSKLSSVTSENIIWVRSGGRSCWGHWLRGTRSCRERSYSSFPLSPPELENKVLGTSFSLLILDLIFYASQIPLRVR